jgi:hypothetical protein
MLSQVGGEQHRGAGPQRHEILAYAVYRMIRLSADVKREAAPELCCGGRASLCF